LPFSSKLIRNYRKLNKAKLYFRLIRWPNLVLLGSGLFMAFYNFSAKSPTQTALIHLIILSTATLFIAAAGYIINDYFDQATDAINKPTKCWIGAEISEIEALKYHRWLNIGAFFFVTVLSFRLLFIYIATALVLYFYAKNWKKQALIGNIIVGICSSAPFLILGYWFVLKSPHIYLYAYFAFATSVLREIVKDLQDLPGDSATGMHTLPIAIGPIKTLKILWFILFVFTISFIILSFIYSIHYGWYWVLLFLAFGYIFHLHSRPETNETYARLSTAYKYLMLVGMIGMFFIE
jgi:4-hydroxybenzoate polyprenyltransferase